MNQLSRRHRFIVERRRQDVLDEAGDCAIQAVIVESVNVDKISRTADREARRRRRCLNRKDKRHKEGLSSDDEVGDKEEAISLTEKGSRFVTSDVY